MNRGDRSAPRPAWSGSFLVLLAVALLPLFAGLGNDLQEFDPTQYAEAGRHIAEGGEWLRPRDNFGPYDDKPPLTFWLIALAIKALGATSFAVRLPSLLAALLAVWATFLVGRELWDLRTGLLAAALFAASPALQLLVADPKIDAVVTAFMAFAVYFFLASRRRPALGYAAWACIAGGLLTKGPIAVAVPLLALLPEALRPGFWPRDGLDRLGPDRAANAPGQARRGPALIRRLLRLKIVAGPLLVALAFLPYAIAAGPRLVYFHLWEQSFGRLTGQSTWNNAAGPFFFLHTAIWAFLPFVPALLLALWSRLGAALRDRALPAEPGRVVLWWLLLPLLGISASRYKLPQYLFWLGPAAALLSARALLDLLPKASRGVRTALVAAASAIALACAALGPVTFAWAFEAPAAVALGWCALLAAAALVGLAALRWGRGGAGSVARQDGTSPAAAGPPAPSPESRLPLGLAACAVVPLSAGLLFFHAFLHPAALAFQPDRLLAEAAVREDPAGRVLPFVGVMPTNAAGFYARRDARPFDEAALGKAAAAGVARVAIIDPAALPALVAAGLSPEPILSLPQYPTSRPTAAFLRARTRPGVVRQLLLVRLRPVPAGAIR